MRMNIELKNIESNPYRNMSENPVDAEQVNKLATSITRNTFWDNIVVREHPTKKGIYQQAHGHHRIAALHKLKAKEASFIVKPLSEAGMVSSMVDENETQKFMSPQELHQNIDASIVLLEKVMSSSGTFSEFMEVVPTGTTWQQGKKVPLTENAFDQAKASYNAGEGFGWSFLSHFISGDKSSRHANIQTYVDSRNDWQEAKATREETEANALKEAQETKKAIAAEAKKEREERAAIALEKQEEFKAKILVEKETRKRKALERAAAKADAKEKEEAAKPQPKAPTPAEEKATEKTIKSKQNKADRIRKGQIDKEIQFGFSTLRQVTDFSSAIKALNIPKKHHKKYAELVIAGEHLGKNMRPFMQKLWYADSGMKVKANKNANKSKLWRKSQKNNITFNEFADKYLNESKKLIEKLKDMIEFEKELTNDVLRKSLVTHFSIVAKFTDEAKSTFNSDIIFLSPEVKRLSK